MRKPKVPGWKRRGETPVTHLTYGFITWDGSGDGRPATVSSRKPKKNKKKDK